MKFGSVCSGIEAASLAWNPLGWSAEWFSEIDPFCCELLKQKYPQTPNAGDLETIAHAPERLANVDVLIGGTPCQSFSVAGLRAGLDDERGNLALEFCRLAGAMRPRWIVWENAPGVLSSNEGRDFGSILGALAELGYGLAYRVLDAQRFGVPQRRRRVFIVGYLGDWRLAAAVLFERESLRGHSSARPNSQQSTTRPAAQSAGDCEPFLTNPEGSDGATLTHSNLSKQANNQQPLVVSFKPSHYTRGKDGAPSSVAPPLTAEADKGDQDPLIFDQTQITSPGNRSKNFDQAPTLAESAKPPLVAQARIRRLTPVEAERLQGMPDNYTRIEWRGRTASDTQRYKAIGNSMAVPVVRWIGERIAIAEELDN